jgi:putative membrane protein
MSAVGPDRPDQGGGRPTASKAAPGWRRSGREPDYRFTLANERTFLAWIRTALALVAGGVLLVQFSTQLRPRSVLVGLACGLCVLSMLLATSAYSRWKRNEVAMRHAEPLPHADAVLWLAGGSAVVAVVLAALLAVS